MVKPIPDDCPQLMPYLIVDGAAEAIEFYGSVLGATERMRMPGPDGRLGHAEIEIGDSVVMLADEYPDMDIRGPRSIGGTPVTLQVYVEDADAAFERAVEAGAKPLRPVESGSMEIGRGSSRIHTGIVGTWRRMSRMSRRMRCSGGRRSSLGPDGRGANAERG